MAKTVRPAEKAWKDFPSLVDMIAKEGDEARIRLRPVLRRLVEEAREDAVLLDGDRVPLDLTGETRGAALCLLRHLLAANGEWRTSTELNNMEDAGPCKEHHGVRWDRVRKKPPLRLFDLTKRHQAKGYRLLPAVWHKQ